MKIEFDLDEDFRRRLARRRLNQVRIAQAFRTLQTAIAFATLCALCATILLGFIDP